MGHKKGTLSYPIFHLTLSSDELKNEIELSPKHYIGFYFEFVASSLN